MNSGEHRIASALALAAAGASTARNPQEQTPRAAIGFVGGWCCGTLPDLIEPATNPNHRQFFHSFAVAFAIGYGLYKLYRWKPETEIGGFVKGIGLVAGGGYLVHLMLDATTPRSLPVLGHMG